MVNTHIVRCITDEDTYLTKGKEYPCCIDVGGYAYNVTCDDGKEGYFMFFHEYEIVGVIDAK